MDVRDVCFQSTRDVSESVCFQSTRDVSESVCFQSIRDVSKSVLGLKGPGLYLQKSAPISSGSIPLEILVEVVWRFVGIRGRSSISAIRSA
ncbi:UNVERIFIED_CONTAM: hypothetical protein Sradi_3254100 [Sesamum radiatum]|uniref:Uncharacterized protein n=1 Tax=Sesamum radiatum TaxID=300843 RepID=A0AAW2R0M9_SESRA